MTREEAIANLNMISVAFVEPVTKKQRKLINDTFEMAIQALSQEPCEDATLKDIFCMGCEYREQEPVLDKIRAEIDRQQKWLLHAGYTVYNVDIALDAIKSVVAEGSDKE